MQLLLMQLLLMQLLWMQLLLMQLLLMQLLLMQLLLMQLLLMQLVRGHTLQALLSWGPMQALLSCWGIHCPLRLLSCSLRMGRISILQISTPTADPMAMRSSTCGGSMTRSVCGSGCVRASI
jgi:hypothetical protein